MATPLTASKMLEAFHDEGCSPREYKEWRTHNRNHKGAWGGVNGVVIHHTAGRDSLSLCYNGTSSLPGPLCHVHLAKSGTFSLLSSGRANHAGSFPENAHNAVVNESSTHPAPSGPETVDGNRHYYGIEVENLGDGKDWYPVLQYERTVKFAAALCRAHGWTHNSVIGHKEGTARKIDPKGPVGQGGAAFDMNRFRGHVKEALALPAGQWKYGTKPTPQPAPKPTPTPAPKPTPTPVDPPLLAGTDLDVLFKTDGILKSPDHADPKVTNKFWTFESYAYETYRRAREASTYAAQAQATADNLRREVAELKATVEKLVKELGA